MTFTSIIPTLDDITLTLSVWKDSLFEEADKCANTAMRYEKTDENFSTWASRTDECCEIMRIFGIADEWEATTEIGKQWIDYMNNK